jgi:uncharacterized phage protein (TIGR01671 family)
MNREIKFRGIREEYNPNWHQSTFKFGNLLSNNSIGEVGSDLSHYEYAKVKPETIGQYTGIKDKNGKEIYEGDVVLYPNKTCDNSTYKDTYFVIYTAPLFKLKTIKSHIWKEGAEIYLNDNVEVIGNIYENPELLKQEL